MSFLQANSTTGRLLRILAVLAFIFILIISSFATFTTTTGPTSTPDFGLERELPTVPPDGTRVVATQTLFHPTGLLSAPKLEGWDIPGDTGDGLGSGVETLQTDTQSRVGLMFINGGVQSVVHIFAEKDSSRTVTTLDDLGTLYDAANLDAAWKDYTGGWKELSRRIDGDQYIIDFEVTVRQDVGGQLYDDVYLARQITKLDQDWLITARLVVPSNNATLLDVLQQMAWNNTRFWRAALVAPLNWQSITDYALGYVLRYPQGWQALEGSPGRPYTIVDNAQNAQVTLSTRVVAGTAVNDGAAASAWVQSNVPQAIIQTVNPEMINGVAGFSVSYADPDPDGNQRSAVTTLLNGANNTLYAITAQTVTRGLDLLDVSNVNVPSYLLQIRSTFFLVPPSDLIATATPTQTATPFLTATPLP